MSLFKAIKYKKEYRKEYTKTYSKGCRNHGSCKYCMDNRTRGQRLLTVIAREEIEDNE